MFIILVEGQIINEEVKTPHKMRAVHVFSEEDKAHEFAATLKGPWTVAEIRDEFVDHTAHNLS